MAEIETIVAQPRDRVGKGAARAARRAGQIPAVIYGEKKPPVAITIDHSTLLKLINRGGFLNRIFNVDTGDGTVRVLPRDVQFDPVRDWPVHVDFLRLGKHTKVTIQVPVHWVGEEDSPGLERGGVLNAVRHDIEVVCPADSIPEYIEVSLAGLEINDAVHISDVKLPEGATPTITDRDFTVATIAAPTIMTAEEEEEEEGEEVEGEEGEELEGEEGEAAEGEEGEEAEGGDEGDDED